MQLALEGYQFGLVESMAGVAVVSFGLSGDLRVDTAGVTCADLEAAAVVPTTATAAEDATAVSGRCGTLKEREADVF